jgi:hypothetical protein
MPISKGLIMRKALIQYKRPYPWWLVKSCIIVALIFPCTLSRPFNLDVLMKNAKKELTPVKLSQLSKPFDGHSPRLIKAIIQVESSGRSSVVSAAGAVGKMQVMPSTAKWLGLPHSKEELKNPSINIYVGSRILSYYLGRENGNLRKALIRYSGGDRKYPDRVFKTLREG